jgi:hypothetical protein
MRRIRTLSLMDPEDVMNLARREPRSDLLDLKVKKPEAGELLRPWPSIKRASPLPLTDEQYEAFLRGEPIPSRAESMTLNDPTRQVAYYAQRALLATGATVVLAVIFLVIDVVMVTHLAKSLNALWPLAQVASTFGWITLASTLFVVALQLIVVLVQVRNTRGLKQGMERLSERQHPRENHSHQAT